MSTWPVEHALCVEYLYAHYSLDAPVALPEDATEPDLRIFAAAREVFNIAVDEMRHLRWVNEALNLLDQPPSVGRAKRIGRQLNRRFALKPLTPAQLQWFVDVERPSQDLTGALDGMYVRLHASISQQPEVFPEGERLVDLIKLIIDEGEDHFERFSAIQRHLEGLADNDYLRPLGDPTEPRLIALQNLSGQNYAVVIGALETTFSLGDRAGGVLIEQARRAMFNLHEINHYMAGQGVRARFNLPRARDRRRLTRTDAHELTSSLSENLERSVSEVAAGGDESERALAESVLLRNRELFDAMHRLIDEDLA